MPVGLASSRPGRSRAAILGNRLEIRNRKAAKLLLNLALLAGDALVRGGRLDVGAENHDGELELAVRGEGPRIMLDPALRETLLTGGSGERIEPRAAGAWLAHALADEAGGSIRLSDPDSDVLLIGVSLPRQG